MEFKILVLLLLSFSGYGNSGKYDKYRNLRIVFNDTGVNFENDVRFFLYTRVNADSPEQLWVDNEQLLEKSAYNSSKATKFMTHGWLNTYQGNNCQTVRKAFLIHDDYNVIIVDWGNVAKLPYLLAASKIKAVGGYVARMISFLESQGSDRNNMSLVGHSLGAHMIGLAGYQTTNKVGHVVGLDPAGPGFNKAGPGQGISTSDAHLVEIIHTNANGGMGLTRPVGHLDFYPNGGGEKQPGCGLDETNDCSHDRAYEFYAEALTRPGQLLAVSCLSYVDFSKGNCTGNEVVQFPRWTAEGKENIRGIFYLRTADEAPFGLGINGTRPSREALEKAGRF